MKGNPTTRYKIVISVLFGLIGFAVNFHSFEFIQYPPYKATLLIGLLFPLLIALAWGWRFGLLSALAGGCQSMWWLWQTGGYAVVYAVPVFTLWVVWHGAWADWRRRRGAYRWYQSKYAVEPVFRFFCELGFFTLFPYVISFNPPPWGPEYTQTTIPWGFIEFVAVKHTVSAYILLLVADLLLGISWVRRFFGLESEGREPRITYVVTASILLAVLLWFVEGLASTSLFYSDQGSLTELLFVKIPPCDLFARNFVAVTCLLGGLVASVLLQQKYESDREKRKAERELVTSSERLRYLVSSSPAVIYSCRPHGDYGATFISDNVISQFGYEPREFLEQSSFWADHIHPDDAQHVFAGLPRLFEEGRHIHEYRFLHRDGSYRWVRDELKLIWDSDGTPIDILGYWVDISGRKQVEEELRLNEESYRTVADFTYDWEYWISGDLQILYMSPSCRRITGYPRKEFLDNPDLLEKIVHPDDRADVTTHLRGDLMTEQADPRSLDFRIIHRNGEVHWIGHSCQSVFGEDGKHLGRRVSNRDITESKAAEEKILRQTALLDGINSVFQEALTADNEQQVANVCLRVAEQLTGSKFGFISELNQAGRLDNIAISDTGWEACRIPESKALILLKDLEIRGIWGTVLKAEQSQIINDPAGHPDSTGLPEGHPPLRCFLGVPLKRGDETFGMIALANKEEGYTDSELNDVEALSVALVEALDRKRAEQELQRSRDELEQRVEERTAELRSSKDTIEALLNATTDIMLLLDLNGAVQAVNEEVTRFLGKGRDELIGAAILDFFPPEAARLRREKIEKVLRTGKPVHFEAELWGRHFEDTIYPVFGRDGVEKLAIYARDVTERKLSEQVRNRLELEREALITVLEDKNAELERFTYAVSHDLKSPLITIKSFLGFAEKDALEGKIDDFKDDVETISSAANKMGRLLDELLELSRIGRLDNPPEEAPFEHLAQEAVKLVSGQIVNQGVEVRIAPDMPKVFVDCPRLVEVLQNLIENAVKFMGDQANPSVEVGVRYEDDEPVFYVRDNGMGLDPAYDEKIFGLFDQIDQTFEGTGIGLALGKRIIEVHEGRIWVESKGLGHGCAFCFTLPRKVSSENEARGEDDDG